MSNKFTLAVEIILTLIFILLISIKLISGQLLWELTIVPIVLLGIMRFCTMFLITIYSTGSLYYYLKWKITGIKKVKIKLKPGKRRRYRP